MSTERRRVVVVGASNNPERYSNRAVRQLTTHGHDVVPVHPALPAVEGIPVIARLDDVTGPVDTVTLYVSPEISDGLAPALRRLHPGRVIFNPGTENANLREVLHQEGIRTQEACTLVLLATGQF